jgi:hypothetical protein
MLIGLCYTKPGFNGDVVFQAFKQGLAAHGDKFIEIKYFSDIKKIELCDAIFMISYPDLGYSKIVFADEHQDKYARHSVGGHSVINTFRTEVYIACAMWHKRMLCLDSGVLGFERNQHAIENTYQIGWDSLKGLGKYYNENSPPDRWNLLGKTLKPWRTEGGTYMLIYGQVRYGVGSQHVDVEQWYRDAINHISMKTKDRIVLRLHPNCDYEPFPIKKFNLKFSKQNTFWDDMSKATFTASYSSHAIVESVLEGIPSVCSSRLSMGYPLFYAEPEQIMDKVANMPSTEETLQWLYNLCYTQWTVSEMKLGIPWNHLRPYAQRTEDAGFENMLRKF